MMMILVIFNNLHQTDTQQFLMLCMTCQMEKDIYVKFFEMSFFICIEIICVQKVPLLEKVHLKLQVLVYLVKF